MKGKSLFIVVFIIAAAAQACYDKEEGSPCVNLCQQRRDYCQTTHESSCQSDCSFMEQVASKAGCTSQYDACLTCMRESVHVDCEITEPCMSEVDALFDCWTIYCDAHPDDPICQ
jgi:hypothetical protein